MRVFLNRPPYNNVPTEDDLLEMFKPYSRYQTVTIDGKIYEAAPDQNTEILSVGGKQMEFLRIKLYPRGELLKAENAGLRQILFGTPLHR